MENSLRCNHLILHKLHMSYKKNLNNTQLGFIFSSMITLQSNIVFYFQYFANITNTHIKVTQILNIHWIELRIERFMKIDPIYFIDLYICSVIFFPKTVTFIAGCKNKIFFVCFIFNEIYNSVSLIKAKIILWFFTE